MRYTTLKGLNDNLYHEFGGDVGLICAVMDIGVYECDLVYKAVMKGKELREFLEKNAPKSYLEILNKVVDENEYELTAYDW